MQWCIKEVPVHGSFILISYSNLICLFLFTNIKIITVILGCLGTHWIELQAQWGNLDFRVQVSIIWVIPVLEIILFFLFFLALGVGYLQQLPYSISSLFISG